MLSIDDILAASRRLAGVAAVTPLLESESLNRRLGCRVLVKAECLQRTGSFKFRGAYNRLAILDPENGTEAWSPSRREIMRKALPRRGALLGIKATIVMPSDAPPIKIAKTKAFGATVVLYDRLKEDRAKIAADLAQRLNAPLIPPYDDYAIMAGQGTAGLEMADQAEMRDILPDAAIICASGGGLAAGCGTALASRFPAIELYTAEPENWDDIALSLTQGSITQASRQPPTICDALMAVGPGQLTWPILSARFRAGFAASDSATLAAMALAFDEFKIVLEPGGAVALGALLAAPGRFEGMTVLVMASGGNADRALYGRALSET